MTTTPGPTSPDGLDRRKILLGAGALGLGAIASPSSAAAGAAAPAAPIVRPIGGSGLCTITPSATPGPFYFPSAIKTDITNGKTGLPFELYLRIVRSSDCEEISGAEVDVWQCDALGTYSGFASQGTAGEDFLRGTQVSNNKGLVGYQTIYPGLYPGRTAHFHIKVRPPSTGTELTSQLYFPDVVTRLVHMHIDPYTTNPTPQTTNASDTEFTPETILNFELLQTQVGLLGWLIIGVDV